jgi:hypothetical protein
MLVEKKNFGLHVGFVRKEKLLEFMLDFDFGFDFV